MQKIWKTEKGVPPLQKCSKKHPALLKNRKTCKKFEVEKIGKILKNKINVKFVKLEKACRRYKMFKRHPPVEKS
jgi:hypothetical protein